MSRGTLRNVSALLAALLSGALLMLWRGYPLDLALLSGLAVGALTYVALGTGERLRNLWRR